MDVPASAGAGVGVGLGEGRGTTGVGVGVGTMVAVGVIDGGVEEEAAETVESPEPWSDEGVDVPTTSGVPVAEESDTDGVPVEELTEFPLTVNGWSPV